MRESSTIDVIGDWLTAREVRFRNALQAIVDVLGTAPAPTCESCAYEREAAARIAYQALTDVSIAE